MSTIPEIWNRIERVLDAQAPEVLRTLAPGASAEELEELETGIGLKLPRELRQSLEIHDGQRDPSQCLKFCGTMSLMSACDILRDWCMLTEIGIDLDKQNHVYSPHRNSLNGDWWRRSCIPFAQCEGYYTCVDMAPVPGLAAGRIVEHTHDDTMEETPLAGFADWLEHVASALETGRFDRTEHGFFQVRPQFPQDVP